MLQSSKYKVTLSYTICLFLCRSIVLHEEGLWEGDPDLLIIQHKTVSQYVLVERLRIGSYKRKTV